MPWVWCTFAVMKSLKQLADEMHCLIESDNVFQRRVRILQAIWREERDYPIGENKGDPLGSMLKMPWAEETLANFLTDEIRDVVRESLRPENKANGQLIDEKRMYDNLLSSQPMAFNLFAPLQCDLALATEVFRQISNDRICRVTEILFEYSPGRDDDTYTGDRSAFDVYVKYDTSSGDSGFIGIEVKYHENLQANLAKHRERYDEIAYLMECFPPDKRDALKKLPLQQIWRDHLLAGIHRRVDRFADGFFAFLSPDGNKACNNGITRYRECMDVTDDTDETSTFVHWTLESFVKVLLAKADAQWAYDFADRYLAFEKVDARLQS